MDLTLLPGVLLSLLAIFIFFYLSSHKTIKLPPPGKTGWPLIGETIEFVSHTKAGHSEKFFFNRMAEYASNVYKTNILGDHFMVLSGSAANKFLFSNGNKLVKKWEIAPIRKVLFSDQIRVQLDLCMRPALIGFLGVDSVRNFVGIMDSMARSHLQDHWPQGQVIKVYPSVKRYTFKLACRLLLSVEDPEIIEKWLESMETITSSIQSMPINLPGTQLNRALRARSELLLQIQQIIHDQRSSSESECNHKNLLSYSMQVQEDDAIIADGIPGMLFAAHETITSTLCLTFKFMAENPQISHRVYLENMEVGSKKTEYLCWDDIHQLRYTWNVVREVMRLYPAGPFLTREAITDFEYDGYHIPKGSKIMTSMYAAHKDPKYFTEPEKFDPSRFEGDGPLPFTYFPFGGGPNMCPGSNYGRLAILVFIHNAIKKFKWEILVPDEKLIGTPFIRPENGLPVRLHPHHAP